MISVIQISKYKYLLAEFEFNLVSKMALFHELHKIFVFFTLYTKIHFVCNEKLILRELQQIYRQTISKHKEKKITSKIKSNHEVFTTVKTKTPVMDHFDLYSYTPPTHMCARATYSHDVHRGSPVSYILLSAMVYISSTINSMSV